MPFTPQRAIQFCFSAQQIFSHAAENRIQIGNKLWYLYADHFSSQRIASLHACIHSGRLYVRAAKASWAKDAAQYT